MQLNKTQKGFTLIEIIIVVTIVGILAMVVMGSLTRLNKYEALEKDTQLVVDILRQARSQTLASHNASQYGVYFASTTLTLFTGSSYSSADTANLKYSLNPLVKISALSLTGSSTSVVFSRLSGETSQSGTITLLSPAASTTKTVTIYATGVVESN